MIPGTDVLVPPAAGSFEVSQRFSEYFFSLYNSEKFSPPEWYLEELKQRGLSAVDTASMIFDTVKLRKTLDETTGKKSGADDGLLIEMLQALPDEALHRLALLFRERFAGTCVDEDIWSHISVVLMPKVQAPKNMSQFRPISVIPVLSKVYYKCMASHIKDSVNMQLSRSLFAYRSGYQTLDQIHSLRQLIEKTNEWNDPLCYCKSDIFKAYDLLKTNTIIEAMHKHKVPVHLIQTVISEWQLHKQSFVWGNAQSGPVPRSNGLPQGDPLSPLVFNMTMNYLLEPLLLEWSQKGMGFPVYLDNSSDKIMASLFCFADDLVIFARNPDQMKLMLAQLQACLGKGGLLLDPAKTQWSHNLCISFDDVEDQMLTLKALKQDTKEQRDIVRGELKKCYQDISHSRKNLRERQSESEADLSIWALNLLDQTEANAAQLRAKSLREKLAALDRSLLEADAVIIEPSYRMKVGNRNIDYIHPDRPMRILGAFVQGSGKSNADIDARIANAWSAFWAQREIFLNRHVDVSVRIKALDVLVQPVLLYAAGSWTPTRADLGRIFQVHMRMCKKILRSQKRPGEEWVDFQIRTSSRIRKIWFKCSLQAWDHACLQRIHSWAGHVARYEAYDPLRWTSVLSRYRDSEYINVCRAQSSDGRHLNRGHARPVWRWEQHFCLYYKRSQPNFGYPTWRRKASDEEAWRKSGLKWAQWRLDRSCKSKGTW